MKFWNVRILSIIGALALAFGLDFLFQNVVGSSAGRLMTLGALYVTLSVSLNLVNGITGQFSIGHAGFFQVGAYTAAVVSQKLLPPGMNSILWIFLMSLAAGVMAALVGFVVGLPSLRLKGDYLAIVTLGFGEIIRNFVNTQDWLGGSYGTNLSPKLSSVFLAVLLAIVCIAVCRNLLKTAHGLPYLAVREDEVAASAMGVNVTMVKVTAFVISSAFAGAAGALFAHTEGFISSNAFTMDLSFMILTMVVLGGSGSITGSAITAVVLFLLPEVLRDAPAVRGPVFVAFLLLVGGLTAAAKTHQIRRSPLARNMIFALVGSIIVGMALTAVPAIAQRTFEADRLRMVIFSISLVVVMLLRPQGIFAHHEFSWNLFKKKKSEVPA